MKKLIHFVSLLVAVIGLTSLFILASHSREPVYLNKSLSVWLEELDNAYYRRPSPRPSPASRAEAEEAIRHIGTNAVPALVEMMRRHDTPLRKAVVAWLSKQKFFKLKFRPPAETIQWRGALGIYVLGPQGKTAIPDLINLILITNQTSRPKSRAVLALGKVGPDAKVAVPILVKALDDPVTDVRNSTCHALRDIGPSAGEAVPALIRHLHDSDPQTRSLVMETLWSLTNNVSLLMPALREQLTDTSPDVRGSALVILSKLGVEAKAAVPAVSKLLEDPDKFVRQVATNAMRQIAGEPIGEEFSSDAARSISLSFVNVPILKVLTIYKELAGKQLDIAREVQASPPVTIKHFGGLTREEALRLIEEELNEQAEVVFDKLAGDRISVTKKSPGRASKPK